MCGEEESAAQAAVRVAPIHNRRWPSEEQLWNELGLPRRLDAEAARNLAEFCGAYFSNQYSASNFSSL